MLGAFLGWRGVLVIIMIASLIGSVIGITLLLVHKKMGPQTEGAPQGGHYLPFGPYLALAGLLYLFFGEWMIAAYMSFLHVPETLPESPLL